MSRNCILSIVILLAFITNSIQAQNSYSKVVNGLKFYVQTDKSEYTAGQEVKMIYKITNMTTQPITYTLPQSPVWNFWVKKDDAIVWQSVEMAAAVMTKLTIKPGETKTFPENTPVIWNMQDKNGAAIGSDKYEVIASLQGAQGKFDFSKVSVTITVK